MSNFPASSYTKVLLLGAIAATSAFVVTIMIVLLCVGCQRKGRTKHGHTDGERNRLMDAAALRKSRMRSISKSDTGLHEMSRLTCNGGGTTKNRPVSMDLLYLPSRGSQMTDLRSAHSRQLPKIPAAATNEKDHTYSEVGQRTSIGCGPEDGLYESVGGKVGEPEARGAKADGKVGNGSAAGVSVVSVEPHEQVTAEYACIRKVRKADKNPWKSTGAEPFGVQLPRFSDGDLQYTPAAPHPRSHEMPRRSMEPFQMHSFPKETMFLGNGEQYIWKPPEEDDVASRLQDDELQGSESALHYDNEQERSLEISEMYSKVCKPNKKKQPPASPSVAENSHRIPSQSSGCEEGEGEYSAEDSQEWEEEAQSDHPGEGCYLTDPCYESFGEKAWPQGTDEADPAYETIDANWKCQRLHNAKLKDRSRPTQQQRLPKKALPGENFYESISDVKQGLSNSSTTTIFTFNDGMEMYVTGL